MSPSSAFLLAVLGAATLPAPAAIDVRDVQVPAPLLRRTANPELSGLVWAPTLERYLVLSDDTGLEKAGTHHAPWVLTMTAAGVLDPEPLAIAGVKELNDAEAITAGPDGTFFLITSHSRNRKGKLKAARCQALHLALEGRGLKVIGRLPLADAKPSVAELAGAARGAEIDIEGVAYHQGALYLGLKEPLREGGRAVILRIADPVGAAKRGKVEANAFTRWAEIPLSAGAGKAAAGISDLLFLADGSLVVLANSPTGADGGGSIWHLRKPGEAPTLLQHTSGLKPEGVALAPDGSLTVVFDRGQEVPQWLRLALPR
jgi:hypothetical protein